MSELSPDATSAVLSQEIDKVFIVLVQLSHSDLVEDIFISSDPTQTLPEAGVYGTISNGQEYIFLPFQIVLQEQSDNLLARAKIVFDNIDRAIMVAIRGAGNSKPIVNIKIIMASNPDHVERELPNLRLDNVKANAFTIEAELTPRIMQNEQFPFKTFNQAGFPGIFGTV